MFDDRKYRHMSKPHSSIESLESRLSCLEKEVLHLKSQLTPSLFDQDGEVAGADRVYEADESAILSAAGIVNILWGSHNSASGGDGASAFYQQVFARPSWIDADDGTRFSALMRKCASLGQRTPSGTYGDGPSHMAFPTMGVNSVDHSLFEIVFIRPDYFQILRPYGLFPYPTGEDNVRAAASIVASRFNALPLYQGFTSPSPGSMELAQLKPTAFDIATYPQPNQSLNRAYVDSTRYAIAHGYAAGFHDFKGKLILIKREAAVVKWVNLETIAVLSSSSGVDAFQKMVRYGDSIAPAPIRPVPIGTVPIDLPANPDPGTLDGGAATVFRIRV